MDGVDIAVEVVFQVALYADYRQTRVIAENPGIWHEKNPLLGDHPSTSRVRNYFLAASVGHWAISYMLPKGKWRNMWQGVTIGMELNQTYQNYTLGIRF